MRVFCQIYQGSGHTIYVGFEDPIIGQSLAKYLSDGSLIHQSSDTYQTNLPRTSFSHYEGFEAPTKGQSFMDSAVMAL